ncbi:MAG: autotransporter domain-containing protein [Rhizobiaceae bacterium]
MSASRSSRRRASLLASSSLAAASLFAGVAGLSVLTLAPRAALAADECGDPSANGAAADVFVCVAGPYVVIDYSATTNGDLELQLQDGVIVTSGIIVSGKPGEVMSLLTTTNVPDIGDIVVLNAAGAAIDVSGQGSMVTVDLRTSDTGDAPPIVTGLVGIEAVNTVGATEVHMNGGSVVSTSGVGVNAEGETGVVVSLISGTIVDATGGYAVRANASAGDASIVAGGTFTGDGGITAVAGGAGSASVTVQSGATASGSDGISYGALAQATGTGDASAEVQGDVTNGGVGVFATSGKATLTGVGSIAMLGAFDGVEMGTTSGDIEIDFSGDVTGGTADGVDTFSATGETVIVLGGAVSGGDHAVEASSTTGDISVTIDGSAQGANDGVNIVTAGAASVLVNGAVGGGDAGIRMAGGAGTVIVAGTVNGGAVGAIRFDGAAYRLELRSTAIVNGGINIDAGTLTLDQPNDFDLDQIISGNGGIAKAGAGALALSGNHTYTGATTVDAGSLIVDGSIAASSGLTVGAGAFVGGTGFLPTTTVGAGGTLSPGNSIGTITVTDNLTFAAGSTYRVEVSPAAADRTDVVAGLGGPGDADLSGAKVVTIYEPGTYVEKQYTILTAEGGLGGTEFTGLESGNVPHGMTQSLRYDANNVYLIIDDIYSPLLGLTGNQSAVAGAINAFFDANGGIPGALVGLLPGQINQLTGEVATGAMGAGMDATSQFLNLIGDAGSGGAGGAGGSAGDPLEYTAQAAALADMARWKTGPLSSLKALAALSGEAEDAAAKAADALAMGSSHAVDNAFATRWHLWGSAYGGGEKVEGNATVVGSADLSARTWGLASGITRNFDGRRVGLALGGAGTSFSLAGGLGSGNATSFNAGLHGTGYFGDGYVTAALAYGYHATRTSRAVPGDTLSARFGAQTFGGRLEAGYRLNLGGVALTPFAAAEATAYRLPAYTETSALGGPLALAYASQTETAIRTELGARTAIALGSNARLTGRAAWVWNADSARTVTAAFTALPGTSFTINGAQPARHAALLEAGVEAAFGNITAKLTATGEFSRNVTSFGAQAKVGFRW